MALEAASFLDDLVDTNPPGGDRVKQGDDHIRLLKTVLQASFPGVDRALYFEKARADLASSATPNLGGTTSNYVNITGTTEIDGFTNGVEGMLKLVRFAGVLTLDNDDTNFPLLTGANIVTAAGDHALFYAAAATEWHMVGYWRKSGEALSAVTVPDASESTEGIVEMATDAEIWDGTTGNKALMAEDLVTAAEYETITDAGPLAWDWTLGINFTATVTANRELALPSNGVDGLTRTILLKGNNATPRTITFDDFSGEVPTITDLTSTRWYKLYVEAIDVANSRYSVASRRVLG